MGIGVKRGKTEHVPLLLQRAHAPGNLVPPGCLRAWGKRGENPVNTGKSLGFSPCGVLLPWGKWCGRKVVGLGEVIPLHCWGPTMLFVGAKRGWMTQSQNAVIAEVILGLK